VNLFQVKIYISSWNALPTWHSEFKEALASAKSQLTKYEYSSIWIRENGSKTSKLIWTSDLGGLREYSHYSGLSELYQGIYDYYTMRRKVGQFPTYKELADKFKVEQYKIPSILARLVRADYLIKTPNENGWNRYDIPQEVIHAQK
jgi:DNA-binding MarR family transcriptional regulator